MKGGIRIGVPGWRYPPWRGEFYPDGLPQHQELVYLRLHGSTELYRSGYSPTALREWADRLHAWSIGEQPVNANRVMPGAKVERIARDVFCYFDSTDKLQAPINAQQLMKLLDVQWNAVSAAACVPAKRPIRDQRSAAHA